MISLHDLLADHQEFHSDLQMDAFITLRSGGTLYGCYKQALREINTRVQALRARYAQLALTQAEIDELESSGGSTFTVRRNRIRATELRLSLDEFRRIIRDTERELIRFYAQAASIRETLAAQGISFPLAPATRNLLDQEMWEHRLRCMAAVDFMTTGRLGNNTVELLQAAPPDMRRRLANQVFDPKRHPELIDWYLTYSMELPRPAIIGEDEIVRLIECCAS